MMQSLTFGKLTLSGLVIIQWWKPQNDFNNALTRLRSHARNQFGKLSREDQLATVKDVAHAYGIDRAGKDRAELTETVVVDGISMWIRDNINPAWNIRVGDTETWEEAATRALSA